MTVMLSIILSNTITKPIKEVTQQATELAEGNFTRNVAVQSHDEIGQLGEAFNYMSMRLRECAGLSRGGEGAVSIDFVEHERRCYRDR